LTAVYGRQVYLNTKGGIKRRKEKKTREVSRKAGFGNTIYHVFYLMLSKKQSVMDLHWDHKYYQS